MRTLRNKFLLGKNIEDATIDKTIILCVGAVGARPGALDSRPSQALGVNDDSLFFVLGGVTLAVGYAFAQWQSYQDDDEDFFDTYESRRVDKENNNRNRV